MSRRTTRGQWPGEVRSKAESQCSAELPVRLGCMEGRNARQAAAWQRRPRQRREGRKAVAPCLLLLPTAQVTRRDCAIGWQRAATPMRLRPANRAGSCCCTELRRRARRSACRRAGGMSACLPAWLPAVAQSGAEGTQAGLLHLLDVRMRSLPLRCAISPRHPCCRCCWMPAHG